MHTAARSHGLVGYSEPGAQPGHARHAEYVEVGALDIFRDEDIEYAGGWPPPAPASSCTCSLAARTDSS
jgi:hypothetical protein